MQSFDTDYSLIEKDDASFQTSRIANFFSNKKILLTGSTGFIGSLILEKLLRGSPDLDQIYLLVRCKKGKSIKDRLEELFNKPCFDLVKGSKNYDYLSKVTIIQGDLSLPAFGLSEEDQSFFINHIDLVIHCGANVRFDQKLKDAVQTNATSMWELLEIAKKMKKLEVLLYIGTAYSNCNRFEIDEVFYKPKFDYDSIKCLVKNLADAELEKITPNLIEGYPNTYTFSKMLAENLIEQHGANLPIAICRPSIILATASEPLIGYVDNVFGVTGAFVAGGVGVLHTLLFEKPICMDCIPADYVVNCCLAIMWKTSEEQKTKNQVRIYNCISSNYARITIEEMNLEVLKFREDIVASQVVWYPFAIFARSKLQFEVFMVLLHLVPAYIVDFILMCKGKEPKTVKIYNKLRNVWNNLCFFNLNEWKFHSNNLTNLLIELDKTDNQLYNFNMNGFDWSTYMYEYARGIRAYILKDPMDTLPEARKKLQKYKMIHYAAVTVLGLLLVLIFYGLIRLYV